MTYFRGFRCSVVFAIAVLLQPSLFADPVPVRHRQGSQHGFVALRSLDGHEIAIGDVTQVVHGDRVTSRTILRFRDGSLDDEITVFTQRRTFRLISDHHVQRGPTFSKPLDMTIDAMSGQVTSRTEDGKVNVEHLDLPLDVSNGLPPNLLMNLLPSTPETKLSFVAPGDKPQLIEVSIKPMGERRFSIGGSSRKAVDYQLHVELGGVKGVIAPMIGKQPPDYHIWILPGANPAFIREEGPLYEGGPIWRIEQISPTFP